MKKFLVFMLIALLILGINLNITQNLNLENIFNGSLIEVYLSDTNYCGNLKTINNGSGQIVYGEIDNLNYILNNFNVLGFTIFINGNKNDVLEKLKTNNYFNGKYGTYGLANVFVEPIFILDNFINFQMVKTDGGVALGFPILLGSY